jgi:hypothetical protein
VLQPPESKSETKSAETVIREFIDPIQLARICFHETVASVGHGEGPVLLGGDLDPIGLALVRRRRSSAGAGRGSGDGIDGHRLRGVERVGDEHAGNRVLLSAQRREMQLPEIFEAGRRVDGLHRLGIPALARAVVHDRDTWMQRPNHHR